MKTYAWIIATATSRRDSISSRIAVSTATPGIIERRTKVAVAISCIRR